YFNGDTCIRHCIATENVTARICGHRAELGSGSLGRAWCSTVASPLRIAHIPPATECAIEVNYGQFAPEVIRNRGALRRIQLNLSINNFEIARESAVVTYERQPDRFAVCFYRFQLLTVSLRQLPMCR